MRLVALVVVQGEIILEELTAAAFVAMPVRLDVLAERLKPREVANTTKAATRHFEDLWQD